ncbi:hypothetical protein H4W33_006464 [Kibdelosporangium phytohabitans]|nr:hypothetical protein [Kibdelosporangium phytohabitans]
MLAVTDLVAAGITAVDGRCLTTHAAPGGTFNSISAAEFTPAG